MRRAIWTAILAAACGCRAAAGAAELLPSYQDFEALGAERQRALVPSLVAALGDDRAAEDAIFLLDPARWKSEAWPEARRAVPQLIRRLPCSKAYWDRFAHDADDRWPASACFRGDVAKILERLGPNAAPAAPALADALSAGWRADRESGRQPRWGRMRELLDALVAVGPPASAAPLLREVRTLPELAAAADRGLGEIGAKDPVTAAAELGRLLWAVEKDTGTGGFDAALALGAMGKNASAALPELAALLKSDDGYRRSNAAYAAFKIDPRFEPLRGALAPDARCRLGAAEFGLALRDHAALTEEKAGLDSGRVTAWIIDAAGRPTLADEDIDELSFVKPTAGQASLCDRVLAVPIEGGAAAFLESPTADLPILSVLAYDPDSGRAAGAKPACDVPGPVEVEAAGRGAAFKCDYACEGASCRLVEWKGAALGKTGLRFTLDRGLTWRKSALRGFFSSQAEFERAFGLDDPDGGTKRSYEKGDRKDGTDCVKLSGEKSPRCASTGPSRR